MELLAPAPRKRAGGGKRGDVGAASARRDTDPQVLVPSSLDLRGARVEEALELLDRYIDTAALAEAEKVTIIHGHGSGALRDALRAQLRTHPLVKSWRAGDRHEGGDGATIVEF